jgi:carbon-monoxide dehydrogenase medium subunit
VKPPLLSYVAATSLEEALGFLGEHDGEAALLAGGQSLMPILNFRIGAPSVLVDINGIPGLDGIQVVDGEVHIGALVRHADLLRSAVIAEHFPVLRAAVRTIGHGPIRNRGTVGGSLAHADPAAEIPACVAAVSGRVKLLSTRGERLVAFEEFVLGPMMTTKASDEIVTGVVLPSLARHAFGFHEIARRSGDFALAGSVVAFQIDDRRIARPRVGLFGVGPVASRIEPLESALDGATVDDAAQVADRATFDLPEPSVGADGPYRRHLARVAVNAALGDALAKGLSTT